MPSDRAKYVLLILAISLLVRILPLFFAANWTDLYVQQALPILNHQNIYSTTHKIFPYSPVSMFLPALCAQLAIIFKIHFYLIMRLPAIIADSCIAVSIYIALGKLGRENAFLMGILYAFNPVAILISSFHGNIITIAVLFSFLAYVVLLEKVEENYRLSALLLGLAIGFRGYPILLLPFFLFKLEINLKKKMEYLFYSIVPAALSFLPFIFLDYKSVFREVFSYSGFPDYGLAAILRAIYSYIYNVKLYMIPIRGSEILLPAVSKVAFLFVFAAFFFTSRKKKLITSILFVFLSFYVIYAGISSQYFLWILPFCYLIQDRMVKYFIILLTWALINFYWVYHPYIIFGRLMPINIPFKELMVGEIVSLSLVWGVCLIWMFKLSAGKILEANVDLL